MIDSRQALYDEAFRLLNRAEELLNQIQYNCETKIARLKASKYSDLNSTDQELLDAQLAHEKERW